MQIVPTSLTRYELTEQEEIAGHVLTQQNLAVIQNMIAGASENRLALDYDSTNPIKYAQDEAFLKGQLSILKLLVDRHVESQEAYLQLQMQSQEIQDL